MLKTQQKKGASLAPIAPPAMENLPAIPQPETVAPKSREERYPTIAGIVARLYAGIVPGIGDTFDLTVTAEVMRLARLTENNAQVQAQMSMPVITYTRKNGEKDIRVFDSVDMREGEQEGDFMARVNRKAGDIARKHGEAHILSSARNFINACYHMAETLEVEGEKGELFALTEAYRLREVLVAVRRDSAFVKSTDGCEYRLSQVLNLPAKETKREPPKRKTASERTTAYRAELLALCEKGARLEVEKVEGDNPEAFWSHPATIAIVEKANAHFYREFKRLWSINDLQSVAARIVGGEVLDTLR